MYDDSTGNIPSQLDLGAIARGNKWGGVVVVAGAYWWLDGDILRFVVKPLKYNGGLYCHPSASDSS